MKIQRYGYKKYHGPTTIIDDEIKSGKPKRYQHPGPKNGIAWSAEDSVLEFTVKGMKAKYQGENDYGYTCSVTPEELAFMVENAVYGSSEDLGVRAQAKSISAYIREVLAKK